MSLKPSQRSECYQRRLDEQARQERLTLHKSRKPITIKTPKVKGQPGLLKRGWYAFIRRMGWGN